jgi:hypothetical protein
MRGAGKTGLGSAVLAAAALLVTAPAANAAVTIGSDLQGAPGPLPGCSSFAPPPCTMVNLSLPNLAAPSDGVVVRWRIHPQSAEAATHVRLQVVRRVDLAPVTFRGLNTGQPRTIGPFDDPTELTFPTRQRIHAGDQIALRSDKELPVTGSLPAGPSDVYAEWTPPLADGETRGPPSNSTTLELFLNADIEPDADGDGFGDETQDDCPEGAGPRNGCETTPPETTITKGPARKVRTRKRKQKVKFKFVSSEPGSEFLCEVDDEPPVACRSPDKERFDRGRHSFVVQAVDSADNADPTPAAVEFKVKRKKKRKHRH